MLAPTLTAALVHDHQRHRRIEAADHHRGTFRRATRRRRFRIGG